jgi:ribbon-helix-helix CopG family protein
MRQTKIGKITASVTLELTQLERLNAIANRAGVSRSTIVRTAIERELERYEQSLSPQKVDPTPLEEGRDAVPRAAVRRP